MAEKVLSAERVVAGQDFLAALKRLGLHPEGLFWAFDDAVDEPALVLVTKYYDEVGPLELNRLLFKAYNAAATPKSISPFIIRLHSPFDDVVAFINQFVIQWGTGTGLHVDGPDGRHNLGGWKVSAPKGSPDPNLQNIKISAISIAGTSLHAFANGLYLWTRPKRTMTKNNQWKRIVKNVSALAA